MALKNKQESTLEMVIVANFLEAIKTRNVAAFWNCLSRESQGYLRGCWVGAGFNKSAGEFNIDELFAAHMIETIIDGFKTAWEPVLDNSGASTKIVYSEDGLHAEVKIVRDHGNSTVFYIKGVAPGDLIIPLIAELDRVFPVEECSATWKIDYLKLLSPNKAS